MTEGVEQVMEQTGTEQATLTALRLSEEKACAGYLAARKDMKTVAVRLVSRRQLAIEQPSRVDYRRAFYQALEDYNTAAARTRRAYNAYIQAQIRSDAQWTVTEGCSPRVLADTDTGKAAA